MLAVTMTQPVAHFAPVHKRPKLSLQTSSLPLSYACSSRALSINPTASTAVTPTTLNTFNNTHDLSYRSSPVLTQEPARPTPRPSKSHSPRPSRRSDRSYNANLPYGVKPILKNGAVRNETISASPCTSTRRIFFPQPKTVSFKKDLEEEVVTVVYTAKHLDLFAKTEDEDVLQSIESAGDRVNVERIDNGESVVSPDRLRTNEDSDVYTYNIDTATSKSSIASIAQPLGFVSSGETSRLSSRKRRWEWTLTPTLPIPPILLPTSSKRDRPYDANEANSNTNDDPERVVVSMESTDLEHTSESSSSSTSRASIRSPKRRRVASTEDKEDSDIEFDIPTSTVMSHKVRAASW